MPAYLAAGTIFLMIGMVIARVLILKRAGVEAMKFGQIDKTDFLIPPFALFYIYVIIANAFHLPRMSAQVFFASDLLSWAGVACCVAGLCFLLWSLVSFGPSFRVGIDPDQPNTLVTKGAFGVSRNPIYVAFAAILVGQFLVFPNWILLVYLCGAA